ncbi:MAG: hypothetical protein AAFP69_23780, partial [Planctomycetota bacterium]
KRSRNTSFRSPNGWVQGKGMYVAILPAGQTQETAPLFLLPDKAHQFRDVAGRADGVVFMHCRDYAPSAPQFAAPTIREVNGETLLKVVALAVTNEASAADPAGSGDAATTNEIPPDVPGGFEWKWAYHDARPRDYPVIATDESISGDGQRMTVLAHLIQNAKTSDRTGKPPIPIAATIQAVFLADHHDQFGLRLISAVEPVDGKTYHLKIAPSPMLVDFLREDEDGTRWYRVPK